MADYRALGAMTPSGFGPWVREEAERIGLTFRRLGMLSGVEHSTISRLVSRDRSPSLETAIRVARAIDRTAARMPATSTDVGQVVKGVSGGGTSDTSDNPGRSSVAVAEPAGSGSVAS